MTDQSSDSRDGFVHEACLYQSDDQVLSLLVPFLREAHEHGEAAVVDLDARKTDLLRSEMGSDAGDVEFVEGRWYTNPATAIRGYLLCFESLVAQDDIRAIRAVGELPPSALNGSWHAWRRYEAAINVAFEQLPVWGICLFDGNAVSPEVASDVVCVHRHLVTPPGTRVLNELFVDPRDWIAQLPPPPRYEVQRTTPGLELVNPEPHDARTAIGPLASELSANDRGALLAGVSEIVSNATAHGEPPVTLRAWARPGYVIVTVDDSGPGIHDPFAGLISMGREMGAGGLGLWITHQLCSDVTLVNTVDGFQVRLVGGDAHAARAPH